MARPRKKWRLTYPGGHVEDRFTSKRATYEFLQSLARGGTTGAVRVWVDEGAGRGWDLYERVNLAEIGGRAVAARDEITISRYGRGACPVCDRAISLTKAGVLRTHGREKDVGQRFMNCRGSGQMPKED
jgi:hypothetical protein